MELKIGQCIVQARHKNKITQAELANFLGVSKAAVSKWESGASYPDITILPKIATYFNLSIDDLIGYEPQMTREEIRKTYIRLRNRFETDAPKEVLEECESLIQKYYSCFPFLKQMAVLFMNHANLFEKPDLLYDKALFLIERVRTHSDNADEVKESINLQATIYILTNQPERALEIVDETIKPTIPDIELVAQIQHLMGETKKASATYQIAIYQHVISLISDASPYLLLHASNAPRAKEIINRTLAVAKAFQLNRLHPNSMLNFYLTAAQIYCLYQETENALSMLEEYGNICKKYLFPVTLHGDDFFDELDAWFEEFDIGNGAPRGNALIQESLITAIRNNPAFSLLQNQPRFQTLLQQLEQLNC